jgi:hypothetical protein
MSLPRMTTRQVVAHLNEHGYPSTVHQFYKWSLYGDGPKPVAKWGRNKLYDPAEALALAERRLRPVVSAAPEARSSMTGIAAAAEAT